MLYRLNRHVGLTLNLATVHERDYKQAVTLAGAIDQLCCVGKNPIGEQCRFMHNMVASRVARVTDAKRKCKEFSLCVGTNRCIMTELFVCDRQKVQDP